MIWATGQLFQVLAASLANDPLFAGCAAVEYAVRVKRYDPDNPLSPQEWLALPEEDRISRVVAYHEHEGVKSPSARLHAAIHVVVENQIALGENAVRDTVERLQAKGMTRHDALHRIGSVVTELLLETSTVDRPNVETINQSYEQRLAALIGED